MTHFPLSRRSLLGASALSSLGFLLQPRSGWAGDAAKAAEALPNTPVLLCVFLRGAADGLNIVVPHADANYYKLRRSPDEHLLIWQMYWRGENFYTQNEIFEGPTAERTVFLGDRNAENLKAWMAKHRGRRAFFVVERSRWASPWTWTL